MIEKIIDYCARNKFIVILFYALIVGWGIWAVWNTQLDCNSRPLGKPSHRLYRVDGTFASVG